MSGQLLACWPDGRVELVPNTYEGIKHGLDGATLDFLGAVTFGMFVDDNGMVENKPLNVPASYLTGIVLYGPVVLCAAETDGDGETLPPPYEAVNALMGLANQWAHVVDDAARKGQSVEIRANIDTYPGPEVVELTKEMFDHFLETGELP